MSTEEEADKQYEPTPKKLEDARRKGDVPKSVDLSTAASYGAVLVVGTALGAASLGELASRLAVLLDRADTLGPLVLAPGGTAPTGGILLATAGPLAPWFAVPAGAVILSIVAQRAFVIAPDKLQPKLERISPVAQAKNKFGRAGLFEFAKSALKLVIYCVALGVFLTLRLPEILATIRMDPAMASAVLGRLGLSFLWIAFIVSLAIGIVDFAFQSAEHSRKNRMSRKELTDETKDTEGDPHIKQQRRQKGYDIATNRMLQDVPEADVVIVNPQHYAVALKWTRLPGSAPVCVAKGVDEIAARIREAAATAGVPLHRDPPTARALHATVEIGQEIRSEHYRAVAAAIRFAEAMRRKARERG